MNSSVRPQIARVAGLRAAIVLLLLLLPMAILADGGASSTRVDPPNDKPIPSDPAGTLYAANEVIVYLAPYDTVDITAFAAAHDLTPIDSFEELHVYVLESTDGADLDSLIQVLRTELPPEHVHPNYLVSALQPVQGSFPFSDDKHVGNYDDQPSAVVLDLATAHSYSTGADVKVGVIDGGVDYTFPELAGSVTAGWDFVDNDADPFDEPGGPNTGHGTFVAGVVHLVAPDAEIAAYRVADPTGSSDGDRVAKAIVRAVQDSCRVINLSMVVTEEHFVLGRALEYARDNDVVVVAAAGNEQLSVPLYPASDSSVLCVAAVDSLKQLAELSRYGSHVDVCAPGMNIYSPYQGDLFAWWSGTSFSTPFVSGLAAAIIAKDPVIFGWSQTRDVILTIAENIDDENPEFAGLLGAGMIDPVAALSSAGQQALGELRPNKIVVTFPEGSSQTTTESFTVESSNAPAAFNATSVGYGAITLENPTGSTNDSLYFLASSDGLAAGGYVDTIKVTVDGVTNNPLIAVVEVIVEASGPTSEYATLSSSSESFTIVDGYTDSLARYVSVNSTNAPAAYTVTAASSTYPATGQGLFTSIPETSGMTGGAFLYYVKQAGLPPGTYEDTLLVEVDGVSNNPQKLALALTILEESATEDTAFAVPDAMTFTYDVNTDVVLTGCVTVESTVAPQNFTATIPDATFAALQTTSGHTFGDSLCFVVDGGSFPVGTYHDIVEITVDNAVNNPVTVELTLNVVDLAGGGALGPDPASRLFLSDRCDPPASFTGSVIINSPNEPAAYTANASGEFVILMDHSSGMTPDTIEYTVLNPVGPESASIFEGGIGFAIDGIRTLAPIIHGITVVADTASGGCTGDIDPTTTSDMAAISPGSFSFSRVETELRTYMGCLQISVGSGQERTYGITVAGDPQFITLQGQTGTTPDSLCFVVDGSDLPVGYYTSVLMVTVEGTINSPVEVPVQLEVLEAGSAGTTAEVWPETRSISVDQNATNDVSGYVLLSSANAPADWTGQLITGDDLGLILGDLNGTTDDSIPYSIPAPGLRFGPGVFTDTLRFNVAGADNNPVDHIVRLVVTTDTNSSEAVSLAPPSRLYLEDRCNPTPELTGAVVIESNNAPAAYAITLSGSLDITIESASGTTPDTVRYSVVNPIDQQSDALYSGTISFAVDGIDGVSAHFITVVADTSSCSGGGDPDPPTEYSVVPEAYLLTTGGLSDSQYVWVKVLSPDTPKAFTVVNRDFADFASPSVNAGVTPDSFYVYIGAINQVGAYYDTIDVTIDGAPDNPYQVCFTLTVSGPTDSPDLLITEAENYPNPFNPATEISFTLSRTSRVELAVYNVLGRKVGTLVNGVMPAGLHSVSWDATRGSHSSGVYFFRVVAEGETRVGKMLLLK